MIETGYSTGKMTRFSAQGIARYLTERLKAAGRAQEGGKKGRIKERLSPLEIEQGVAGLLQAVLEKEDLLKQIVSDQAVLDGQKGSITQEEIMNILDGLEATNEGADIRSLTRLLRSTQGLEGSVKEARRLLAEVETRIAGLIVHEEIAEAFEDRITRKIAVIRSARNVESLQKLIEKCEIARMELLARRNNENAALTRADNETIEKYASIRRKALEKVGELTGSEEVYYETKRRELLGYRRQLLNGGFVETPSIREEVMKIVSHSQLGIPVLLRGHLGAGKTEVALHVARKYFGCEPEFISGSEEATKYDIYGRTQIGVRPQKDRIREFEHHMREYVKWNPDAPKEELKEVEKQYYQAIVVKGLTISFFQYGPLVRAMRDGKPLIIDEMDGIPHSIIMRLNHVLTRRAGDTVKVQENGGGDIIVKKGFAVLATANIKSARYKREELDAAFLSRWWSNDIKYTPQHETYQILVASLLDRRGNLQIKGPEDLDDLKRLTEAAAEIQRIFTGEHMDYFGEGADAAREIPASLKKSVLSLRHLWNIVRPWKARNFDRPLEFYILNEFIKPAVVEDQVYLVQLFCRFRFFKTWKPDEFGIPGLTEAKLLAFQGKQVDQTAR
ncbi:MAG TPA: AAA family ATPase [Syntrophorhabdaceae bacterium]|nr:AAA family ATPase [Syntrophorhabdaceae bacterium]HQM82350.1 AAA family ATPase [Syntrophorhabdaceae bacterium]